MSKRIRVKEDIHAALTALKGDDETFDELLSWLISERHETIQRGAGLWADTDTAEKAREAREEMKRGIGTQ